MLTKRRRQREQQKKKQQNNKKTVGLISKKQLCTCSTLFCTFLWRCFARRQRETRNFLVTRFYGVKVVCGLVTFFFAAAHLYLGGR